MAADVTSTVWDCVICTKSRVPLRKQPNHQKLFPAFAPLELVAIDILGPHSKSQRGFQYTNMMADRLAKLV